MESKLTLWFSSDFGGCGHIRSLWVNDALNSYYGSKKLYEGLASSRFIVDANILKNSKIYHFQRQITDGQLDYIKFIYKYRNENHKDGLIFYDLDDRVSDIPEYNYARRFFNTPNLAKNLLTILDIADIITVSTQEMADWVKSYKAKSKVIVVPNYVPKTIYKPYDFVKSKNDKPRIIWAGSANHYSETDKGDFEPIFDLINNTVTEFDWYMVGIRKFPSWLKHLEGKINLVPWNPMVAFPSALKSLNGDFGFAPLVQNIFNEAKSNIKLLDYWSADLVTMTSKMKPYIKDNDLFFSGDWKNDREVILNIFNDETLKNNIIKKQNIKLSKYWLEDNLNLYMDMFNLKY